MAPMSDPSRLNGCGLILVNPPWRLAEELTILLPVLAKILGRQGKGTLLQTPILTRTTQTVRQRRRCVRTRWGCSLAFDGFAAEAINWRRPKLPPAFPSGQPSDSVDRA